MYIHIYAIYTHICVYIYMYIHIYTIYIYTHISVYLCVCIYIYLETNDSKNKTVQHIWMWLNHYSNIILPQEKRGKIFSNTQHNLITEVVRERTTKKKVEEIINIRAEITGKEMKKIIAKINKTETWFFGKIKLMNS